MKKSFSAKAVALVLAGGLLAGATVGGTLAWLMDETDVVKNTFTVGEVDVSLTETPYTASSIKDGVVIPESYGSNRVEGQDNAYPTIPGATYKKDPLVSVKDGSEDCYLFVKFEQSTDADKYLNYASTLNESNGWKLVNGKTNVWYRVVYKVTATPRSWELLENLEGKGTGITLEIDPGEVTSITMNDAIDEYLKWTAYAVQFNFLKDNDGPISGDSETAAARAWALVESTV